MNFIGAYLQGSFAIGDLDNHSAVDFIAAIENNLTENQVDVFQYMHPRIYDLLSEWARQLEESDFPRETGHRGTNLWHLDHGLRKHLQPDHCHTGSLCWARHEQGVTLVGPSPKSRFDPISAKLLRMEIYIANNHWGHSFLADPEPYRNRFYQGDLVLNYSRLWHDLHTRTNGFKRAGAEWAKANLHAVWIGLIDHVWDCRLNPVVSDRTHPDPRDFVRSLGDVAGMIAEREKYR